jgi:cell division septation protein DedD
MDDFSGTPIDRSSYNRTIFNAGVSQTNSGYWGKGINLTYSYLGLARPIEDDFTICTWIKTTSVGGDSMHWRSATILESETGYPNSDFGFGIDNNGKLVIGHGDTSQGLDYGVNGNITVNDDQWHFACATRTRSSGFMELFVDGVPDQNGSGSNASLNSNPNAYIGYGTDGAAYFNGLMDDLIVFNRVLSDAEISHLYNSTEYEVAFYNLPEGRYNLTSYVVNQNGNVAQSQTRYFNISLNHLVRTGGSNHPTPRLSVSLDMQCNNNTITTSVGSVSVHVIDEESGFQVYSGTTDENGEAMFTSCGRNVRVYANRDGYRSTDERFTLDSCSCLENEVSSIAITSITPEPALDQEPVVVHSQEPTEEAREPSEVTQESPARTTTIPVADTVTSSPSIHPASIPTPQPTSGADNTAIIVIFAVITISIAGFLLYNRMGH